MPLGERNIQGNSASSSFMAWSWRISSLAAVQASGGATINPPVMQHGSNPDTLKATGRLWDSSDHRLIEQVRFDVAVTAEEQTKMEGGFNAGIQVLGIGGKAGIDKQLPQFHCESYPVL